MSFDDLAKEMDNLLGTKSGHDEAGEKKRKQREADENAAQSEVEEETSVPGKISRPAKQEKKGGFLSRLLKKEEELVTQAKQKYSKVIKKVPEAPAFEPSQSSPKKVTKQRQALSEREATLNKKEQLLNELTLLLAAKKKSLSKEESDLDKKRGEIAKLQAKLAATPPPAPIIVKKGPDLDKASAKKQKLLAKLESALNRKHNKLTDEEQLLLKEKEKIKLLRNELNDKDRGLKSQLKELQRTSSQLDSEKRSLMKDIMSLENNKYSLDSQITDQKKNLSQLLAESKQKGKDLDERSKDLDKREKDLSKIGKRQVALEKLNSQLSNKREALGNLESALASKRDLLDHKEKELRSKEKVINQGFKDAESKRDSLQKDKLILLNEVDVLTQNKQDLETSISEAATRLDETLSLISMKEKEFNLSSRRKEFTKMQDQINELNIKIDQNKLKLHEQEQSILAKRTDLDRQAKELKARVRSFDDLRAESRQEQKRQQKILAELSSTVSKLRDEKGQIDNKMGSARSRLDELSKLAKAKEADLISLERRERDLMLQERAVADVKETKRILSRKEADLQNIDSLLTKKQDILNKKESELVEKRQKTEYELQRAEANKRVLYSEISKRQAELTDLTKLRDLRQQELDESEAILKSKETDLLETIRELELDKEVLDRKEESLAMTVKTLENDKLFIEQKEEDIIEKITHMEELEVSVKPREEEMRSLREELDAYERALVEKENHIDDEFHKRVTSVDKEHAKRIAALDRAQVKLEKSINRLENKEAKISGVKELRASIVQLENKLKKLDNQVIVRQGELEALDSDAMRDTAISLELERREKALAERQSEVEENEMRIREREAELFTTQSDVEAGEFQGYVEHEMEKYTKPKVSTVLDAVDIYSLIEEARELITMGRFGDARSTYSRIGTVYEQLDATPSDKKRVYYAILELKTDIELAHLA